MLIFSEIKSAIVGITTEKLFSNRKKIITRLKLLFKRNEKVRMSLSYLFSIQINNQYLLIKGNRIDQFQPIGGVYHYRSSFREIKNKWNIQDVNNDQFHDKNDLRIFVPANKVLNTIEWFHSKKNREVTVHREFKEELVDNQILSINDLQEIDFEFKRVVETGLKFSEYFRMDEYNIYEVYDVILNPSLERKIEDNVKNNSNFIFCDSADIESKKISLKGLDRKIGEHAQYTL